MSDSFTKAAMSVTPPVQGKNIVVLDLTTSSQNIRVPDAWIGKYLSISPRGGTAYFAFIYGSSGPTVDEAAKATIASDSVTPNSNASDHVGSGGRANVDMRNVDPFTATAATANSARVAASQLRFGWKGSAAGQLVIVVSDGPVSP